MLLKQPAAGGESRKRDSILKESSLKEHFIIIDISLIDNDNTDETF